MNGKGQESMESLRKGSEVELMVEKLAFGGKALSRLDGLVIFMDRGLPGQRVAVRIVKKKANYAEAQTLRVVEPSPHQVEPACAHFGVCGGCLWQDLDYAQQLAWKHQHVCECLAPFLDQLETPIVGVTPSPALYGYRNKMEFTFSAYRWLSSQEVATTDMSYDRSFALGLHVRGRFDRVFDVHDCRLESPEAMAVLEIVRREAKASGLPPYHIRSHQGVWRFVVVRETKKTGQRLVHLITADVPGVDRALDRMARILESEGPPVTTFVHSVNRTRAHVAQGVDTRVFWGTGAIEEHIGNLRFRISAQSFFQTNTLGAEHLYKAVQECAGLTGAETVWDLYCGTGSITLSLAAQCRKIVGFELVEEAVTDAYRNAALNGVENCRFFAGDLKEVLRRNTVEALGGQPDVVVTDPPRSGMHPKVVQVLRELAPRRIVAVSCNPSTLARDLTALSEAYRIHTLRPFDLFPHTPHIECVVRLDRK